MISTQWVCELDALSQLLRIAASMETRLRNAICTVKMYTKFVLQTKSRFNAMENKNQVEI